MLVVTRRIDELIDIGDEIQVMVVRISGDKVRLGITAPKHIPVHRHEVAESIKRNGQRRERKKQ